MADVIEIDGSVGESGGQVLRTALSLAAITNRDVSFSNIRAKRDKPGLKRQHLTCVNAVAEISGTKVIGNEVGSRRRLFPSMSTNCYGNRDKIGTLPKSSSVFRESYFVV